MARRIFDHVFKNYTNFFAHLPVLRMIAPNMGLLGDSALRKPRILRTKRKMTTSNVGCHFLCKTDKKDIFVIFCMDLNLRA